MAKEDHAAGSSISGRRVEASNPEHLESIVQKTGQQTVPAEQTPNKGVRVFKLDVVRSPTKVGLMGRVEEIGQQSTKSEESSPDPGYRGGLVCVLFIGEIRVQWTDLSETVENVDDVVVVDRPFVHGDTVSAVSDKSGQTGTVVDVDLRVDLRSFRGEERIIRNVPSRELVRLRRGFNASDFVLNGSWVGRVEDICDDVTVAFEDGGVCELCPVLDYLGNRRFRYYPGQRLKDGYFYSTAFHDSRWIVGFWDPSRVEGTVIRVQAGSVDVQWLASSTTGRHELISVGRSSQTIHDPSRDLELLSCLAHENWRLGDWCHLLRTAVDSQEFAGETFSPRWASRGQGTDEDGNWCRPTGRNDCSKSETHNNNNSNNNNNNNNNNNGSSELGSCSGSVSATKRLADEAGSRSSHRRKLRKVGVKRRDLKEVMIDEISQKPFLIVRTRTRVDVVWQSGVRQNGILSTDLIRIHGDPPAGDQFYPEQYVVQESSNGEDEHISQAVKRVGVVSSFDVKERVARVRWLKHVSSLTEAPSEFAEEERVSVHELHRHLDYRRHRYGDIVTRPFAGRNIDEQLPQLKSGRDHQLAPQQPDLTRVGKITGLKDGGIQVTWADGIVSTVGPQAVISVGHSADFSEDDDHDDEGEDGFDYLVDS